MVGNSHQGQKSTKQINDIWSELSEMHEKGALKTGALPKRFCESSRLLPHDSEASKYFQNYMEYLTKEMLPGWDFDAHPIRFLISDVKDPNAGVIRGDPAIMLFNSGLIDLCEGNENILMHVLGHELGHQMFKEETGKIRVTTPEEILVNMPCIQWMYEQGYNPQPAVDFAIKIKELHESTGAFKGDHSYLYDVAIALTDEHLTPAFDADILNSTLTGYKSQIAGDFKDRKITQIPEEFIKLLASENHISAVEQSIISAKPSFGNLTWQDQLEFVLREIETAHEGSYEQRVIYIDNLLDLIENDVDDFSREIGERMITAAADKPEIFDVVYKKVNVNLFDEPEMALRGVYKEAHSKACVIVNADDQESFLQATADYSKQLENLDLDVLYRLEKKPSFAMPTTRALNQASKGKKKLKLPWDNQVKWAIEEIKSGNETPAIILTQIGVEDPRLYIAMLDSSQEKSYDALVNEYSGQFKASRNLSNYRLSSKDGQLYIHHANTEGVASWNKRDFIKGIIDRRDDQSINDEGSSKAEFYKFEGELPFADREGLETWFSENKNELMPPLHLSMKGAKAGEFRVKYEMFKDGLPFEQARQIKRYRDNKDKGGASANSKSMKIIVEQILPFQEASAEVCKMLAAQLNDNHGKGREIVREFFLNSDEKPGFKQLMLRDGDRALLRLDDNYIKFITSSKGLFAPEEKAELLVPYIRLPKGPEAWMRILEVESVADVKGLLAFTTEMNRFSDIANSHKDRDVNYHSLNSITTNTVASIYQAMLGCNYLEGIDITEIVANPPENLNEILSKEVPPFREIPDASIERLIKPLISEGTKEAYIKIIIDDPEKDEGILRDYRFHLKNNGLTEDKPELEALVRKEYGDLSSFRHTFFEGYFNEASNAIVTSTTLPYEGCNTTRDILRKHISVVEFPDSDISERADIYKNLDSLDLFPNSDYRDAFRKEFLSDLNGIEDLDAKHKIVQKLISGDPIKDPIMRQKVSELYIENILQKQINLGLGVDGLDDGSPEYFESLERELTWADNQIEPSERYELYVALAEKLETQKDLSYRLRDSFGLDSESVLSTDKYFRVGEAILIISKNKDEGNQKILDFLMAELNDTSREEFGQWIREGRKDAEVIQIVDEPAYLKLCAAMDMTEDKEYYNIQAQNFYDNFWQAPLAARMVFLDQLLITTEEKDYSTGKDSELTGEQLETSEAAYDRAFNYVTDLLLPEDVQYSKQSRIAIDSFKNVLPANERALFLSALLAANDAVKQGGVEVSAGERLALVFEMMGPAYIVFGQGISNYPDAPMDIREPMIRLTKNADKSPRWEIFKRYEDVYPQELKDGVARVGPTRGSASYNESIRLEKNDETNTILSLQRAFVERRAIAGFGTLRDFVDELLRVEELEADVAEGAGAVLKQAQEMAPRETDILYRVQQVQKAQEYYNGLNISIDGTEFNFETATWLAYGADRDEVPNRIDRKEWAEQDEMPGVHFDELPEGDYKKAVAKAVVMSELMVILSGQPIDNDRHTAQLRIDPETNHIGLFDHGALELLEPTKQEKQMLAKLLVDITRNYDDENSIPDIFREQLKELKEEHGEVPNYLVKVERGLLAMTPFFDQLEGDDLKQAVGAVFKSGSVDKDILETKIQVPVVGEVKLGKALKFALPSGKGINIKREKVAEIAEAKRFDYNNETNLSHPSFPGMKPKKEGDNDKGDEGVDTSTKRRAHHSTVNSTAAAASRQPAKFAERDYEANQGVEGPKP